MNLRNFSLGLLRSLQKRIPNQIRKVHPSYQKLWQKEQMEDTMFQSGNSIFIIIFDILCQHERKLFFKDGRKKCSVPFLEIFPIFLMQFILSLCILNSFNYTLAQRQVKKNARLKGKEKKLHFFLTILVSENLMGPMAYFLFFFFVFWNCNFVLAY